MVNVLLQTCKAQIADIAPLRTRLQDLENLLASLSSRKTRRQGIMLLQTCREQVADTDASPGPSLSTQRVDYHLYRSSRACLLSRSSTGQARARPHVPAPPRQRLRLRQSQDGARRRRRYQGVVLLQTCQEQAAEMCPQPRCFMPRW